MVEEPERVRTGSSNSWEDHVGSRAKRHPKVLLAKRDGPQGPSRHKFIIGF